MSDQAGTAGTDEPMATDVDGVESVETSSSTDSRQSELFAGASQAPATGDSDLVSQPHPSPSVTPDVSPAPADDIQALRVEVTPAAEAVDDRSDRMQKRIDDMEQRLEVSATRARVQWVRSRGLSVLQDAELTAILPKVDPDTPEGLAALDAWREEHSSLFPGSPIPKAPTVDSIVENVKPNTLWTAERLRNIVNRTLAE